MKNKNVFMILSNGFNPDIRVFKEAKYLVGLGYNVTILCWDRRLEFSDRKQDIIDGVNIERFEIESVPGSGFKQIIPFMKFLFSVKKYLKNKDYEYLHCHDFDGILIGMFTKNKKNKKIIFDMHEIYKHYAYAKNFLFDKIFKRIIKKSDYIVYVNDEQIKDFDNIDKLVYLPNYPEKSVYLPIEKNNDSPKNIRYIGSLRDYDALKTLADISKLRDDLNIGLYGNGISYERLKEDYKNTSVDVHGKYDGIKEIGEIYRNTDILYCVYNPEVENWRIAYPTKLFEAIVTKTPIIVSEGSVASEFVNKYKIGVSCKYNNVEDLNKKIQEIIDNYHVYINQLDKISDKYAWDNAVISLKKIYKD